MDPSFQEPSPRPKCPDLTLFRINQIAQQGVLASVSWLPESALFVYPSSQEPYAQTYASPIWAQVLNRGSYFSLKPYNG